MINREIGNETHLHSKLAVKAIIMPTEDLGQRIIFDPITAILTGDR